MRLLSTKMNELASLRIPPLQIEVTGEEILADLRYPAAPEVGKRRA